MEMKIVSPRTVLLALAISGAAACGGRMEAERAAPPPPPAPVRTEERAMNGHAATPVDARVGEEFVIDLRGNRTTGYRWDLAEPVDSSVVVLVGHRYQPDAAPPGMVGSGGVDRWTFRGAAPGTAAIVLGHFPPGTGRGRPATVARYAVTVR